MRFLLLFMAFAIGCSEPKQTIVDFDFQGIRLGDPAPARLKIKDPKRDLVNEQIEGTKANVWYTIMDGNVESLTITFNDPHQAIEAYEKKFGVKAKNKGDDAVWMTQYGEFSISKKYGNAHIFSEKYSQNATESAKKKIEELGSKL